MKKIIIAAAIAAVALATGTARAQDVAQENQVDVGALAKLRIDLAGQIDPVSVLKSLCGERFADIPRQHQTDVVYYGCRGFRALTTEPAAIH